MPKETKRDTMTSPLAADLSGLTILIVDDHEDSLYVLDHVLTACHATVVAHRNPVAALGYLAAARVNVIISDLSMPQMDGIEFIEHVRKTEKDKATPAIALTAFPEDYVAAGRAGYNGFVPKPVNLDRLCAAIGEVIEGGESTGRRPAG